MEAVISQNNTRQESRKYKPKKKHLKWYQYLFIFALCAWPLAMFGIWTVYCSINGWVSSFQRWSSKAQAYVYVGWKNYQYVFDSFKTVEGSTSMSGYLRSMLNSLIIFAVNNFIMIPVGVFFAYMMYKKTPGSNFFRVVFFFPNIISPVVLTMAFKYMFSMDFGPMVKLLELFGVTLPTNGLFADISTAFMMILIYNIWAGLGYYVILITGTISRIPNEIIEAGQLEGISVTREFWQVVFPLSSETVKVLFLNGVGIIGTYFLTPMLLTGGGPYDFATTTIALAQQNLIDAGNANQAAAFGIIVSLVMFPLTNGVRLILDKCFPTITY